MDYKVELNQILSYLKKRMVESASLNTIVTKEGIKIIQSNSLGAYQGLWPDDYLFPLIVTPELISFDNKQRVINFLTDSIVGLDRLPDRVELDGLPIMQPGTNDRPHARHMPLHLPGAWIRLLDWFDIWGVTIPRKREWAGLIKRCLESVPFACGLAYSDPQDPVVGFPFHDTVAVTGLELMSTLVLYRGFQRAIRLFADEMDEKTINLWKMRTLDIENNIMRLYDPDIGAFTAGTRDCKQFDVWGNGLVFGFPSLKPSVKDCISSCYVKSFERIFRYGFTRQVAEENGWQRPIVPYDSPRFSGGAYASPTRKAGAVGNYVNGGYWSTGTGYAIVPLFHADPDKAIGLLREMLDCSERFNYPEWMNYEGTEGGVSNFMMGFAIPALAIKSILEETTLLSFF